MYTRYVHRLFNFHNVNTSMRTTHIKIQKITMKNRSRYFLCPFLDLLFPKNHFSEFYQQRLVFPGFEIYVNKITQYILLILASFTENYNLKFIHAVAHNNYLLI